MFGLIGKITTIDGRRDEVITAIATGSDSMPGNLLYHIAADTDDPNVIWITESWDNEAAHQASLQIPSVRSAIQRAMPFIAGVESVARTSPR
jgi:quinol monooxygenase YgiN